MKKLLKKPQIIFLLVVLLLALAAAPFLVRWANPNREGLEGQGPEVVFYHMNSCGHCEKMRPEWDKFVNENSDIRTRAVEASDGNEATEKGVTSFPTVLLLDGTGKKIADFNDKRNAAALKRFYEDNKDKPATEEVE